MSPLLRQVLAVTIAAATLVAVHGQVRKPRWWMGHLSVSLMNSRHSPVTDWGLGHVNIAKQFTILDVGCGGGRTIDKLAGIATEGKVYGIDYSPTSVAASRATNKRWVEAGRVDVREGSVSQLPFPDATFDLVSAVETHYYWPDLNADLREILRVLKPGGRLVIIAETYRGMRFDIVLRPVMKLLGARYLTIDQHRDLLTNAGYAEVEVTVEAKEGWICAVGRRPVSSTA